MNKPTIETVYVPVKVEDDSTFLITEEVRNFLNGNSTIEFYKNGECYYKPCFITKTNKSSDELEHLIIERLEQQQLITFTPEEFNQLLEDYGKEVLKKAAKNAKVKQEYLDKITDEKINPEDTFIGVSIQSDIGYEDCVPVEYTVHKDSITEVLPKILEKWKA